MDFVSDAIESRLAVATGITALFVRGVLVQLVPQMLLLLPLTDMAAAIAHASDDNEVAARYVFTNCNL